LTILNESLKTVRCSTQPAVCFGIFAVQLLFMKSIFLAVGAALFLIACGGQNQPAQPAVVEPARDEVYETGLELVAKSGCLSCHLVEEKNIGPAYRDIAAKYEPTEANITMLAAKVRKGGKGVWGEVPMTAHPQLSQTDAEAMVKYILKLKK
jgi:cytochrome c